jgi:GntR family transcriptional regulator
MRAIDRSRPEPLYHQVEAALRERILNNEWGAGTRIPTEDELCDFYHVSRITVRQAIRKLVEEGYLERGRGRGTFVKEPTLTAGERGLRSFSEEMRALGLTPGARLIDVGVERAGPLVGGRLAVPAGAEVVRVRRLRTGNGKPIGLQTSYLPHARVPGLARLDLNDSSLYELLELRYGIVLTEAHETFWVAKVSPEDVAALHIEPAACAFRVERVAFDADGAFEFTASVMRGDRYRIRWVLKNHDRTGGGSNKEKS